MERCNTVAVLGCGSRGNVYIHELSRYAGRGIRITAVCDINTGRAEKTLKMNGVGAKIYGSDEEFFAAGRLADVLIIATQDKDHYGHAKKALELGYHLLLEKPVARTEEQMRELADMARERGRFVLVSHVLRYAPFYQEIARVIRSGEMGEIVDVNITENVAFWHFAHSYVRGPWRSTRESAPLVLAKCSHDFDLLCWFVGPGCAEVKSFGSRTVFREESAPEGSGTYCLRDCAIREQCPYDAAKTYFQRASNGQPVLKWTYTQITGNPDATEDDVLAALKTGPYGRCVYRTDNDVCDHQVVAMRWKNGATATLTINPFSNECYRRIAVHGTKGELFGCDEDNCFTLNTFLGLKSRQVRVDVEQSTTSGHLGGDAGIVQTLVGLMCGDDVDESLLTTLDTTLTSHHIGFGAEKSRLEQGASVVL